MTLTHQSTRRSEQGFTLVELAIVMVIIGLLIGGILKGQELIASAKISATVTQLKGLDAALNTFQDKYNAQPGLMKDATTRLRNCSAPCTDATATAYGNLATFPADLTDPKAQVFIQLSAADLISGIDATGSTAQALNFGKALPPVKAGGGMWMGTAASATDAVASGTLTRGFQYAVLNGTATSVTTSSGVLNGTTAAQIDRKLDDGQPQTGSVQASGGTCVKTDTPASYDEAAGAGCTMVARVLN